MLRAAEPTSNSDELRAGTLCVAMWVGALASRCAPLNLRRTPETRGAPRGEEMWTAVNLVLLTKSINNKCCTWHDMRVGGLLLLLSSAAMGNTHPASRDKATCSRKTLFGNTMLGASFDPLLLNERVGMQKAYSIEQKGWLVGLEWKRDPHHGGGMGAFATEDIAAGTLIRRSPMDGGNFLRMTSYEELASFCALGDADYTDAERAALKEYVTDYLFRAMPAFGTDPPEEQRVYGMWFPGCGDNCINAGEEPNVEDRVVSEGVMGMYATRDIPKGAPLLSDYDAEFGTPPAWIAKFANDHLDGKTVFAGMNHNSAGWSPTLGG